MELLTTSTLNELNSVEKTHCLSLYMPTHRSHPDNLQDPIKYKNLLRQLESSMKHKDFGGDGTALLAPFEALANDHDFWNQSLNGLAVFATKNFFKVVKVPIEVKELAVVADSFHTKPLRQYLQSADRYQVVGLSLHDFQLFEGNRHGLSKIELPDEFPDTIKEALGEELTEKHLTVASYGGVGGNKGNMVHGHGSRKDELDLDAEKFFRAAADVIYEKISKPSGLPLILAALAEHQNLFQSVNKNPFLLKEGIAINPNSIDQKRFAMMAWEIMEPVYTQNLQILGDSFQEALLKGRGSDNITQVAKAAIEGRVDVLLIESDRIIAGKLAAATGIIERGNLEHPEFDDLLDDISELVVARGGKVVVVPKELMSTRTGLAATFRF
ncbi:baeRF3 domain-containing protein [Niastella populi]|uniref:Uncharacterized protein n=1 Tax=Niastella populi TaxID=550983 RepID=A0A1V9ENL9_9BACT|nr:hypothetical protein [Niastella populi]OQP47730.1 hypothetical protein A4R26_31875 [Niastella populi]